MGWKEMAGSAWVAAVGDWDVQGVCRHGKRVGRRSHDSGKCQVVTHIEGLKHIMKYLVGTME